MAICKKCGWGIMSSPRYRHDEYGERLISTCLTCGYAESKPTVDAKPKERAPDDFVRRLNEM